MVTIKRPDVFSEKANMLRKKAYSTVFWAAGAQGKAGHSAHYSALEETLTSGIPQSLFLVPLCFFCAKITFKKFCSLMALVAQL